MSDAADPHNPRPLARRAVLRLASAGLGGVALPALTHAQADTDAAGALGQRLDQAVAAGELSGLHAVVVLRQGRLWMERYYTGKDERWGRPLGEVRFDASTLHDLRSVTKSIVGLLYGAALADGKVPAPDTPLLDAFSAYPDLAADPARRQLTVAHALTMTLGLEWNEDLPYTDPRNSEIAMEAAPDRYRYVLSRPIVFPPGERWRYCGGATALLGHLIARGTGGSLAAFARQRLLAPLGITEFDWITGSNGEPSAASGLRLSAPSLARIGHLLIQRGQWEGKTVVPESWITQSLTPRVDAWEGLRYGYQWSLAAGAGAQVALALGNGGQRLVVLPQPAVSCAILAGNYNRPDQIKTPLAVQRMVMQALG